jgi:hypothetical protein
MRTKRLNRRDDKGRRPVILVVVGLVVVGFVALLAVGGYVAWRFLARGHGDGPPVINLPGLGGPRDRLVGRWETAPGQPGNGGLPAGAKLTYEFKSDGGFTSTLTQAGAGPNPPEPATWEVNSESGKVLKLHMRRPITENQKRDFGEDFNSYDLEVEILSDNQIRVTSFKSMAAVRVFDRKR